MRVSNVYRPLIYGCRADERLVDVARWMKDNEVGALAVLDGEEVLGIITERDLVAALATSPEPGSRPAAEYASKRIRTAGLDEDAREVARRMLDEGIRHLPVQDDGRVVGMVSMRDLLALEIWST
ncbi:CBS domain-containing protein [Actinomadura meyerae]|jgi:CBS domain-containing protein|uniref:CBS domain-containing protein n=1 Tax=Actinomadura meyerae TaxID=240840 RepID=A0A239P1R6_9ACTN|nr:CBS domain-containing protein [Actinomadura meyerae]SNT61081.1 CBS domain-containing protein [Actinomadura meyerae]